MFESGSHSGAHAVRHPTKKASSVLCNWKPLLCNLMISLSERHMAVWLLDAGNNIKRTHSLHETRGCRAGWSASVGTMRVLLPILGKACIVVTMRWHMCVRRGWSRCIIAQSSCWQGIFARFSADNPIFGMLACRNLAWRTFAGREGERKLGGAHLQRFKVWRWETCLELEMEVNAGVSQAESAELTTPKGR